MLRAPSAHFHRGKVSSQCTDYRSHGPIAAWGQEEHIYNMPRTGVDSLRPPSGLSYLAQHLLGPYLCWGVQRPEREGSWAVYTKAMRCSLRAIWLSNLVWASSAPLTYTRLTRLRHDQIPKQHPHDPQSRTVSRAETTLAPTKRAGRL